MTNFFQHARPQRVYFMSKILSANCDHIENNEIKQYCFKQQTYYFQQLNISKYEGDKCQQATCVNPVVSKYQDILDKLESKGYSTTANATFVEQFEHLKISNHFNTIEDIEQEVASALGQDFSFEGLFYYGQQHMIQNVKHDIVALYNFIINSKIMTQDQLLQLLYPLKYIRLDGKVVTAMTSAAQGINVHLKSALIGIDFSYAGYDTNFISSHYQIGYFTSDNNSHVFIHEGGHALSFYTNFNPEVKPVLNLDILDLEMNEPIPTKIKYHFDTNFGPNSPDGHHAYDSLLINKALNYFIKHIFDEQIFQTSKLEKQSLKLLILGLAVPSFYGRQASINREQINGNYSAYNEGFAEGFAYYFLTPPHARCALGDLGHQFWTQEVNANQTL